MVTGEKVTSSVILRYRLGTVLVWLGVFTWVPFILLRVIGEKPPFLLFLPFHLIGVIGGSHLRAMARKELGRALPKRSVLHTAGHGMILLGILVWVPYLYLKLATAQPVDVLSFLPFHLIGVLGGASLHALSYMIGRLSRRKES